MMRGHGTVNIRFAFEALLDSMAEALILMCWQPVVNLLQPDFEEPSMVQGSYGLPELY